MPLMPAGYLVVQGIEQPAPGYSKAHALRLLRMPDRRGVLVQENNVILSLIDIDTC